MRAFLLTRGRNRDYRFLGAEPERWWEDYLSLTSLEQPTVLIQSLLAAGGTFRLYLSAIPSGRRDSVQTPIRVSLLCEGTPGPEGDALSRLCGTWLFDLAEMRAGRPGRLSSLLDELLPEARIEAWLERGEDAVSAELDGIVQELVGRLPLQDEGTGDTGESWVGDVDSPACRGAFLMRVAALGGGRARGRAVLVNLLEDAAAVEQSWLMREPEDAVVLLDGPRERLPLPQRIEKKKSPGGPPNDVDRGLMATAAAAVAPGMGRMRKKAEEFKGKAEEFKDAFKERVLHPVKRQPAGPFRLAIPLRERAEYVVELFLLHNGWKIRFPAPDPGASDILVGADGGGLKYGLCHDLTEQRIRFPEILPLCLEVLHTRGRANEISSDELQQQFRELGQWISDCHNAAPPWCRFSKKPS